jgi:hypothetical protein
VVWNPAQYGFIKEGEAAPDTVNPSLWRQSQLILIAAIPLCQGNPTATDPFQSLALAV